MMRKGTKEKDRNLRDTKDNHRHIERLDKSDKERRKLNTIVKDKD